MDGQETDYERRYNDQQRYVRELEAKAKAAEVAAENWQTFSTDPRFKAHYEATWAAAKGEANGESRAQEKAPDGPPAWFNDWLEKEHKPLRSDFESRRQKAVREWTEKVEAREKEFAAKHPELAEAGWFGAKGKLNEWMARTGEDDVEKAIRANLEPKYWYAPESANDEKPRTKREPSERPVEGRPVTKVEEPALNAEQALMRARARFNEDSRVAG